MPEYSATDKTLHRLYLGNYSISRAALEMEEILYGKQSKLINVKEYVFVTGLARSGTTAVMRRIFETCEYASLQYSNMPFLLNPNLWNKRSSITSHERAHNDGIIIDGNSPEEFDEYFWKSQLDDSYIKKDYLKKHKIDDTVLKKYKEYIHLICLAKKRNKYISKNNNNVLRLDTLRKISSSKIIFLLRQPFSHASSLMKLHWKFSDEHRKDSFKLEYFDFLGHYEFGLHHKPFKLTPHFKRAVEEFNPSNINYWVCLWMNYYDFIRKNITEDDILICFEDLTENPKRVYDSLSLKLLGNPELTGAKKFSSTTNVNLDISDNIKKESLEIYNSLLEKKL